MSSIARLSILAHVAGLVLVLLPVAQPVRAADTRVVPELAGFGPFLGKTWKGLVDSEKGVFDVSRWEPALAGRAVRIVHSVADGAYGGETFVTWDRTREELVYSYFTTAGFTTQGVIRFEGAGRFTSRESVAGDPGGVTEVEATQELLDDGRMRVRTRMLRNGAWEDRPEVIYRVDPAAEVVLPATVKPADD